MRYLIQRVVHNDNGWAAPTRGRLQFTGDGDYLEKTGFGHEDWNFSGDICADGYSYAYMYFRPKSANGPFNILFATYDKGEGWLSVVTMWARHLVPMARTFRQTLSGAGLQS